MLYGIYMCVCRSFLFIKKVIIFFYNLVKKILYGTYAYIYRIFSLTVHFIYFYAHCIDWYLLKIIGKIFDIFMLFLKIAVGSQLLGLWCLYNICFVFFYWFPKELFYKVKYSIEKFLEKKEKFLEPGRLKSTVNVLIFILKRGKLVAKAYIVSIPGFYIEFYFKKKYNLGPIYIFFMDNFRDIWNRILIFYLRKNKDVRVYCVCNSFYLWSHRDLIDEYVKKKLRLLFKLYIFWLFFLCDEIISKIYWKIFPNNFENLIESYYFYDLYCLIFFLNPNYLLHFINFIIRERELFVDNSMSTVWFLYLFDFSYTYVLCEINRDVHEVYAYRDGIMYHRISFTWEWYILCESLTYFKNNFIIYFWSLIDLSHFIDLNRLLRRTFFTPLPYSFFVLFFINVSYNRLFYGHLQSYLGMYNILMFNFLSLMVVFFYNFVGYFWDLIDLNYFSPQITFFFFLFFLFGVLCSWIFFSYMGIYGVFIFNLVTLFFFWFSLLFLIPNIFFENKIFEIKIFNWVFLNLNLSTNYSFLVDSLSFSFILLTTTIALFVYIYAFSYFRYEPLVDRFLLFLLSFVVSMIFLVSSSNLIMIFLGWELIGLTSFFLINFWTTKTSTLKSAFKAFSFNKISDFFLLMFIIIIYNAYHTIDVLTLSTILQKNKLIYLYFAGIQINLLEISGICLLFCAFIKSAQIGGHIWLPDSMEAPVPASALIHSATLVSAGIYLILRFNFLFNYTFFINFLLPLIGSLTAAYGGICAAVQTDLKKILAYSTISHCGFLTLLCSIQMNEFVIIYLYVHGFFKAIIFMCVGNILRISQNYQDCRKMGNFFKILPFEFYCILISIINLSGLPFTFGFFTKHLLFLSLDKHIYIYYFVLANSLIGAISSIFYSYTIIVSIFFGPKKSNKSFYIHINRIKHNNIFYTNSSLAGTISILLLFIISYLIITILIKNLLSANILFSDYINITLLSTYYSFISLCGGFNLNLSYINIIIIIAFLYLFFFYSYKISFFFLKNKFIFFYFFLFFFIFFYFFLFFS